ncbi:protoglobin domain-containing protein [Leisingera sp. S232]|uniref:protoglobin domain-containing protein n=1 Tax=Leisingera sp. S232 TaxID=3415132 RepID=UPI003C7BDC89
MATVISSSHSNAASETQGYADTLSWFDITPSDRARVRELAPVADRVGDEIINDFYSHILSFEEAAKQFTDDEQINRVKQGQKRYFQELVTADLDEAYAEDRRRIGSIHERAGITPTLYIGSYAFYLQRLGHLVLDAMEDDPAKAFGLVLSLMKIAHFDMALALETYVGAREKTIETQQRQMSELPTPVLKLRDGLLLIPVVGTLDSYRARSLTVQMLEGIRDYRARAVVLDITGVDSVDSAVANHLIQTMTAARLMGAKSILTGISADVAQALVKIGVDGESMNTAGDLQQGMELADKLLSA